MDWPLLEKAALGLPEEGLILRCMDALMLKSLIKGVQPSDNHQLSTSKRDSKHLLQQKK